MGDSRGPYHGCLDSPSPPQKLAFGAPNQLIRTFPLALVPVFLVPLSILQHLASLNKLRQTEPAQQVSRLPLAASGGNERMLYSSGFPFKIKRYN